MIDIAIENDHSFPDKKGVIVHSYVSLPEGKAYFLGLSRKIPRISGEATKLLCVINEVTA